MTHRRTSRQRLAIAATGVAALLAGSMAVAQANASTPTAAPEPQALSSVEAGALAATLAEELGVADAGSYYEAATDTLVVNVADAAAASVVEAAGAEARLVDNTLAELTAAKAEVGEFAVPGTAWSIDPVSNAVKVKVDSTVTGKELADVRSAVEAMGDLATLETVEGEFEPYISGGQPIYASGARCSLGFNVTLSDGSPGFLTAGHCGNIDPSWSDSSGGGEIGQVVESVFPGSDYALVQYTASVSNPSEVDLYNGSAQQITEAGEAFVGQEVSRSGSTTGVTDGQVTGLDVTVRYAEGDVHGTIETTVCAEPGDSGGALFAGSTALGLTSGGSGDCNFGGTTFFQPVTDALAATGASLP